MGVLATALCHGHWELLQGTPDVHLTPSPVQGAASGEGQLSPESPTPGPLPST